LKNSKLICLFAHYNAGKQVEPYVLTYLQHLESMGFAILFISSAIDQEQKSHLQEKFKTISIYERENKAGDAGILKWALGNNIIPADTDYLLLTNDSLFGPVFPLAPIVASMLSKPGIDFWGLTDSYRGAWHIESYFLCISKKVFTSNVFKEVLSNDHSKLTKQPLAQALSNAGFKGEAYIPCSQLSPDIEAPDAKNPTHFYWDQLIEDFHFPFVRKELILQNPENIQTTDKLFTLIEKHSSYPVDNIKQSISAYLASFDKSNAFPNRISVLCHLFYPGSVYSFLTRILALKSPQTQFIFNLSALLCHNTFVVEMLRTYFPGAPILCTSNQGRDIGGKMALYDTLLKCGVETDYTLIIHDKLSPHTPTGIEWREKLLKIIAPGELPYIFKKFQNKEVGIIVTEDMVKSEYNPDKDRFTCTSSDNIFYFIRKFNIQVTDYKFAAGTIFWIRTSILHDFFSVHSPLSVRKELEKGNKLDFDNGTNIHAWERLFSFIANSQGFKTVGI
jgi:lipopolysaccharide biosynthesis protein